MSRLFLISFIFYITSCSINREAIVSKSTVRLKSIERIYRSNQHQSKAIWQGERQQYLEYCNAILYPVGTCISVLVFNMEHGLFNRKYRDSYSIQVTSDSLKLIKIKVGVNDMAELVWNDNMSNDYYQYVNVYESERYRVGEYYKALLRR